jgi:hypothetical protein
MSALPSFTVDQLVKANRARSKVSWLSGPDHPKHADHYDPRHQYLPGLEAPDNFLSASTAWAVQARIRITPNALTLAG